MCIDCNNNCLEEVSDKCVLYTGNDFKVFDIKGGNYYDKTLVSLLTYLDNYINQKIELHCIYTGTCDNCETSVTIPDAVKALVNKVCTLTAKDVIYDGDRYCIGDRTISSGAVQLLGKTFKYSVQPNFNGSSVSYDLSDVIKSLPPDHKLSSVNTVISGKTKGGKSIIAETGKSTVGVTVENDRFPINMDIGMRVSTPTGDVKLVKNVNIPAPLPGNHISSMAVMDYGSATPEEFTLETFMESIAAQVCSLTTDFESFKNMDLVGCSGISYTSKDIRDIVAQQGAVICGLISRIEKLDQVSFNISTDKCGLKSYSGGIQGGFEAISSQNKC